MPKGKKIARFRADSASYQAEIFNWCEKNNIKFAVGGRMDSSVKEIISDLDEMSKLAKILNGITQQKFSALQSSSKDSQNLHQKYLNKR